MKALINAILTTVILTVTVDAARKGAPKAASKIGQAFGRLKEKVYGYFRRMKEEVNAMKRDAQKLRELADSITDHVVEEVGGGIEKGSPSYIKLRKVILGEIAKEALKQKLEDNSEEPAKA